MTKAADLASLARYGFRNPEHAVGELPGGWKDDEAWRSLVEVLGSTADPDRALLRLRRLGEEVVARALQDVEASRRLANAVGFSEYLTDLLVRTPGSAGELLGDPPAERRDVLSFRDAEILRIAADDLSAPPTRESFTETGSALSRLADACVERVLGESGSEGMAVMAMGKYGAEELNYASDIDVLFVVDGGDLESATRVARKLMEVMNGPPVVFRVDADLRPEGRDGPLVRTLDAYRAYYGRWAQVWEFQALIKCRLAAGDETVGRSFMEMIEPFVWPDELGAEAVEQVRALKARAEREVERRSWTPSRGRAGSSRPPGLRQVKLGRGGIRDVEFAVQLLQLVHGRHNPDLRVRSTLEGLDVLGAEGYVGDEDVAELVRAYTLLRHTEHRLQLEAGRQTHTLPADPAKREHVARGLGFRDRAETSALEAFEKAWSETTNVVRTLHERLFYRPLMETFAATPSVRVGLSPEEADERLRVLGFDRAPRVREAIAELTAGGSRRAKVMRALLPGVLAWMAETPDPDAGLLRLVDLAKRLDGVPHLLAMLRDEPPVVELLCEALGTGPVLAELLQRDPGLVGALDERIDGDVRSHARSMVGRASSTQDAVAAVRRFKDGEFLRLASRDLAAGEDPMVFVEVSRALSDVGDACLEAALELARAEQSERTGGPPPGGFAVVGMGRLGGRELGYASDLDVMFVYEGDAPCPDGSEARLFHAAVSERIVELLGSTPPVFRVDTELRPEGRSGAIVRSFNGYRTYYERWASLWEFQALIRARHVAGDPALTAGLLRVASPRVWPSEMGPEEIDEIRRMKARIERERVKAREDSRYQVKLGVGGLADVEFTVQLLQMRHGHAHPEVRTPNTLEAIEALRSADLVDRTDVRWLRDAYLLLNRVRNHMFLLRGLATDALPTRDEEAERLARSLGYGRLSRSRFLELYHRTTRRARRVTDRLFYGED